MPRLLPALVVLLLPLSASAQFGVSSIDDPLRPNRTPLAEADEVPVVLLLGLGGPTATLVNPARAARLRDRFAYGTIRPQSGPLSVAGLFGARDRRWLLVADNATLTQNATDKRTERRTDEPPSGGTFVIENEDVRESSFANATTRARLLFVGRTDYGGYAFGLFGGYRSATNESLAVRTSLYDEENPNPPFTVRTRRQTSERAHRLNNDDFAVGAEMAFAGRTWDLATAVSYQHRDAEAALTDESDFSVDFMDADESILERQRQSLVRLVEGAPDAVDAEMIGALRPSRDRDDYLFAAVSGTLGGGTVAYGSATSNSRLLIHEIEGTVVEEVSTDDASEDMGDVDLATRAARVSLGYAFARHRRRLTVLAAVNPRLDVLRVESAVADLSGSAYTSQQETDHLTIALDLPLYLRFDVTKRLDVFGGGVYTYAYDRLETTIRPLYPDDLLEEGQTLETTRSRTIDEIASSGRLFAGAVMTFRSGLTAQAAFHGDLAAIDGWTVSLGYHF